MKSLLAAWIFFDLLGSFSQAKEPEISAHFPAKQFSFLGAFYGNFAYARLNEELGIAKRTGDSNPSYCVAVASADEELVTILRDPKTNHFAVRDRSNANHPVSSLSFNAIQADSLLLKAWALSSALRTSKETIVKGRTANWISVSVGGSKKGYEEYYVTAAPKIDPLSEMEWVNFLTVTRRYSILTLFADKNAFQVDDTDMFRTPMDVDPSQKASPIKSGSLPEAILSRIWSAQ